MAALTYYDTPALAQMFAPLVAKMVPPAPSRRRRRLSLSEAAKQAGRPVASVTDHADGSRTYAFEEVKAGANADELNEWDRDLGSSAPPKIRK
jgi:hypothetical protein